jgi:peptidoglycan/xylan/chitin deacetylase (PgdA/CDA1 family)
MMRTSPTAPADAPRPALPVRAARRVAATASDRARRSVKLAVSSTFFAVDTAAGLVFASRRRGRRATGVILMYHDVPERHRERFARQCDAMVRLARPSDLAGMHQTDDGWRVAVTFDDGFRSFADVALPELDARGIPSTLFVPTEWSHRSATQTETDGWPVPLTPTEVAALPATVEIGSHSRNHAHLPSLDDATLHDELQGSRDDLARFAGRTVRFHAFPFGEHDDRVDLAARAAGYERCYGIVPTEAGPTDGYVVGRVQVDPTDWPLEFRLKMRGAYRWMSWWITARDRARSAAPTGARS